MVRCWVKRIVAPPAAFAELHIVIRRVVRKVLATEVEPASPRSSVGLSATDVGKAAVNDGAASRIVAICRDPVADVLLPCRIETYGPAHFKPSLETTALSLQ